MFIFGCAVCVFSLVYVVFHCICVPLRISIWVCLSVWLPVSDRECLFVTVCVCVGVCDSVCVSQWVCVCVSVPVSVCSERECVCVCSFLLASRDVETRTLTFFSCIGYKGSTHKERPHTTRPLNAYPTGTKIRRSLKSCFNNNNNESSSSR